MKNDQFIFVLILFHVLRTKRITLPIQSIRFQRLTRTMDLASPRSTSVMENHSELVKLPALRAINKGIK